MAQSRDQELFPHPSNLYLKPFPKQLCPGLWLSSEGAEQGWAAEAPSETHARAPTSITNHTNQDTHNIWFDTHTPATSLAPLLEARASQPSPLCLLQESWAGVGRACVPPASQTLQETGLGKAGLCLRSPARQWRLGMWSSRSLFWEDLPTLSSLRRQEAMLSWSPGVWGLAGTLKELLQLLPPPCHNPKAESEQTAPTGPRTSWAR